MARPPLLRTGAFARAASLSIKALRLYHERGLLVPSVVDAETGYRAYSPSQLIDAAIIGRLRGVGVSLADIGAVLDSRDPVVIRKVLADHAERLQARMDAVGGLVDDLMLEQANGEDGGVTVRHEETRTVLAVDGSPLLSDLTAFMRRSAAALTEAARTAGAVVAGPFGACWPAPIEEDRQDVTAFLPISVSVQVSDDAYTAGVRINELPAGHVAVLEHRGPYTELDAAYRRLGAWVAFHAVPAEHPVRENYLRPGDVGEVEPVTELLWPVTVEDLR